MIQSVRGFLLFFLCSFFSLSAWAVLGEKVSSVQDVSKTLDLKSKPVSKEKTLESGETLAWTAYEMKSPSRQIQEHVSPEGTVFAVTWKGVQRPDLKTLLGKYHKEFTQAEKKKTKFSSLRMKNFETENLRVHEFGQARNLQGTVILKTALPEGLKEEDLK